MEQAKLNKILDLHKKWMLGLPGGQRADLSGADLYRADLSGADLSGADLSGADLSGANLSGADLHHAYLYHADLRGADLYRADLSGANLSGAYLSGAKHFPMPIACPDTGAFTAWKKCRDNRIVKLLIPEDAKRCSATTRKCRANKAVVLEITDGDGNQYDTAVSQHDEDFIYKVGETAEPDGFDEDRWNECSNGIHFFITRGEAEAW